MRYRQAAVLRSTLLLSTLAVLPMSSQRLFAQALQANPLQSSFSSSLPETPSPQNQQDPTLKQQPQQSPQEPSLSDLGLSSAQTKPDPDLQARLDRHTKMLKMHQTLGLITVAPIAAACITSALAPPDPRSGKNNEIGRDIHVSLGATSVLMYALTASYAIRAPRIPHEGPTRGGIKIHKYLIWIHAPGMVLTPILGAMAYDQASSGQKVHGIAAAHGAVAWTTVVAYGAAIVAVSWPIHLGFNSHAHQPAQTAFQAVPVSPAPDLNLLFPKEAAAATPTAPASSL